MPGISGIRLLFAHPQAFTLTFRYALPRRNCAPEPHDRGSVQTLPTDHPDQDFRDTADCHRGVLYVLPGEATLSVVRSLHRQAVVQPRQDQRLGKFLGLMKRAVAREQKQAMEAEQKKLDRFASTIVIGACIIAAMRLAREENIGRSSPKLYSAIGDSIALARAILDRVVP